MNARLSWLAGATEASAWIGFDHHRLRRPAVVEPWRPSDGFGFVIERRDSEHTASYHVVAPAGWVASWRKATRFPNRRAANAVIAAKTADRPAGPAAERNARVRQIGPWLNTEKSQ